MASAHDCRALRLETTGPPVPVIEGVRSRSNYGDAVFAVTSAGFLAYAPAASRRGVERTLVWVDRSGKQEGLPVPPREYTNLRLSPDGKRIALDIRDQDRDIWVWDFERQTLTRLTFDPNPDTNPVWTPDGKRIIFARQTGTLSNMYWQASDGTGQPERLIESRVPQMPHAVAPDGTQLLFRQSDPKTSNNLYTLSLAGERQVTPLIQTRFDEMNVEICPTARAWRSLRSGRRPHSISARWRWTERVAWNPDPDAVQRGHPQLA